MRRYYLARIARGVRVEREVTLREFCLAERAAGYHPKMSPSDPAYMTTLATEGFGSAYSGKGVEGRIERVQGVVSAGHPPMFPDSAPRIYAPFQKLADLLPTGFMWGDSLQPHHLKEILAAYGTDVVYQHTVPTHLDRIVWVDCKKGVYDVCAPAQRRIIKVIEP